MLYICSGVCGKRWEEKERNEKVCFVLILKIGGCGNVVLLICHCWGKVKCNSLLALLWIVIGVKVIYCGSFWGGDHI